jgi:tetratricopeptide (TPR) repeat protein
VIEQRSGAIFVGRDRELQELQLGLDDAASGRGRLYLIGGEPGIGKSRLADELAMRAREAGYAVLWGRGWEDAGAPPYWPWVQALRSYVRSTDLAELRHQLGSGAADVAQILPELRDLLPDLAPLPDAESESARFQLFDSTATFLRNAALQRPLLVVVDDLQAADTPSILFLRFLATQLSVMRVLVVGTYRDIALTPDHPLTPAIAELGREPITRTLTLSGLQAGAVGEFIGAASGVTPQSHLVSAVWRETKGNPLFVGEAVRLVSAEGRITDVADLSSLRIAVPAGIREVIARRISHLGDETARALAFGAAIGPEFSVEVLRRVAEYEADQLLDLLDEAAQAGLLLPVTGVAGRYRFSHDLIRESIYDDLAPARRMRLHRRIAEVLEELYGASPDAHLAELAFHFFEAAQGGEPATEVDAAGRTAAKAIDYARRAGDQASRSLAFEEAVRLFRMALAVLDENEPDEETRTDTLLSLGDASARGGDIAGSRATFLEAAGIARRTGMARNLARAALGYGGRLPWTRPGRDTRLIPLLQDALVLLGGDDERLRVRLLARLACAWRSTPDQREQSATLSRQAVELAREQDDPATLSYALAASYWATWWPENPDERLRMANEMVVVAEAADDAERLIDAHLMLFMSYMELGRVADARIKVDDVLRLSDEHRLIYAQIWLGFSIRAQVALLNGDFGLVEEVLASEVAWTSPFTQVRDETSVARMHLFLLRREQGRLAEIESTVRASVEEFPWYPFHRAALACLLLDLGRDDDAKAVFDDLATDEFRALYRDNEWLLGVCMASEACSLLRDAGAAAVLYEQLKPFAGRHAIGHGEGSVGAVDRYLGLLAATLGLSDDAERHFSEAIRLNEGMGARPWVAHSRDDLARLLLRRNEAGDRERANELQRAALDAARALGMTVLEARIAGPATPGQPDDVSSAPPSGVAGVFRREGEYWTVSFGGTTVQIRDTKGMRHLARLLEEPGRELHALDLARSEAGPATRRILPGQDLGSDALGDAGERLDPEAKAAYRRRLEELRGEADEAERFNDPERAARTRQEIEFLAAELAGAVGIGGRDRKAASAAERARLSVSRAIRAALTRIAEQNPSLGKHFDTTVRTGTYCSYNPDPRVPMSWQT